MPKALDLTGQTFGLLTATHPVGKVHGHMMWSCLCTCGARHETRASNLLNGISTRCGSCTRRAQATPAQALGMTIYEWTYLQDRAGDRGMVPHVCGFAVAVDKRGEVLALSPFSKRPLRPNERFIRARWVMNRLVDAKLVRERRPTQSVPDWIGQTGIGYRPHPHVEPIDVWSHRYWATEGREWHGPADMMALGITPSGEAWMPSELQRMKLMRDKA